MNVHQSKLLMKPTVLGILLEPRKFFLINHPAIVTERYPTKMLYQVQKYWIFLFLFLTWCFSISPTQIVLEVDSIRNLASSGLKVRFLALNLVLGREQEFSKKAWKQTIQVFIKSIDNFLVVAQVSFFQDIMFIQDHLEFLALISNSW